jgi:hypothetical protein
MKAATDTPPRRPGPKLPELALTDDERTPILLSTEPEMRPAQTSERQGRFRGDLAGDPVAARLLVRLDVLASDHPQQPDRLGLLGIQLGVLDRVQHHQRVVDQRADQLLAGGLVVPCTRRLARLVVVVVGGKLQRGRLGSSRRTRRIAATSCVTVSWVATASSSRVESTARRVRPVSTPVLAMTWRTASKMRSGRSEARSLARHKVSTLGWNPGSVNASPQATFQAML